MEKHLNGIQNKSANNGYDSGQYKLGLCYENGIGTKKDYNKAFEWYLKSANNGKFAGYYNLGKCYHYGLGTEVNTKEAVVWYKKALDNGIDASTELNKILSQYE